MTAFKTREEYLAYRTEWKANYKALSKEIRNLKNQRKQFKWEYRAKDNNASKRRVKIGENPNYNSSACWIVGSRKKVATAMLKELAEAKIKAGKQREAAFARIEKAA